MNIVSSFRRHEHPSSPLFLYRMHKSLYTGHLDISFVPLRCPLKTQKQCALPGLAGRGGDEQHMFESSGLQGARKPGPLQLQLSSKGKWAWRNTSPLGVKTAKIQPWSLSCCCCSGAGGATDDLCPSQKRLVVVIKDGGWRSGGISGPRSLAAHAPSCGPVLSLHTAHGSPLRSLKLKSSPSFLAPHPALCTPAGGSARTSCDCWQTNKTETLVPGSLGEGG